MKKIFIWGAGQHARTVYETIDKNQCIVMGFIDNDRTKQGKRWEECISIESPEFLKRAIYDYIFITARDYKSVIEQCLQLSIDKDKLIPFWKLDENMPCIDIKKKEIVELENQIFKLTKEVQRYKWKIENYPYELGLEQQVKIISSESLLQEILAKRTSLCRFGDGEFEIMRGKERPWFQKVNATLSHRLKEILDSDEENIMIAVADNFGSLERYTEMAADDIREYLSGGTRNEVMKLLNTQRFYYDTYVSRPYIIYRDKEHAKIIFDLFKEVWKGRNILIVEGIYSRIGVGNDLLFGSESIRRILCPHSDAFDYYEKILEVVCNNVYEDDLVLISLGPTATVLAFDLAKQGIQALDIGQLDNEYEWYLRKAVQRIEIPGKGVAELGWCRQPEVLESDLIYWKQVSAQITGE